MKLIELHLKAFGPFTERVLELAPAGQSLVLIHGPNEAGKSATLRAISDLRFGIPAQSGDNFIHAHPDMRIGALFEARDGSRHSLVRRKGRGATLLDAGGGAEPVAGVENLITAGLTRADHEAMFALDHERLRAGGAALLRGEGEVGAALFEASAGVRSIAAILEQLDLSARKYFMPGTRGKNAAINEALRAYNEQHGGFREAVTRPTSWLELSRRHQGALAALESLELERAALFETLSQARELRSVAPILASIDQCAAVLRSLEGAMLLSPQAPAERASAEAGLAAARHNAAVAGDEADRHETVLARLPPDDAILDLGAAIERLAASAENIDTLRRLHAQAGERCRASLARLETLAAAIGGPTDAGTEPAGAPEPAPTGSTAAEARAFSAPPGTTATRMLARRPAPAARAAIEARLRMAEEALRHLDSHRQAMLRQPPDLSADEETALPPLATRTALQAALQDLSRHEAALERLARLPALLRSARRAADAARSEAGLDGHAAPGRVRPLLDSDIDVAMRAQDRHDTSILALQARIGQIGQERALLDRSRELLLAGGRLPSQADVAHARAQRDAGWREVRSAYIGEATDVMPRGEPGPQPHAPAGTGAQAPPVTGPSPAFSRDAHTSLAQAYEQAVSHADRLIDTLAGDARRAEQLFANEREIALLERDGAVLAEELAELQLSASALQARWRAALEAAGLPDLPPAALREWQLLLADAQRKQEAWRQLDDELACAGLVETGLREALSRAIESTGMGAAQPFPAAGGLRELGALAGEIDRQLREQESRRNTARGKMQERQQQQRLNAQREQELLEAWRRAANGLDQVLADLLLAGAGPVPALASIRARLEEFDRLAAAQQQLDDDREKLREAAQGLELLQRQAATIATALGEPAPADARLYAEACLARLQTAREVAASRSLARQALKQARENLRLHEETMALHDAALARLCQAAGVPAPALLPQAEEDSRRKREAQAELDRSASQLAQASRRPPALLRELLQAGENVSQDDLEQATGAALETIEARLREQRAAEEAARHALAGVDTAGIAAGYREGMEQAAAGVRAGMAPWMRSRLAHALLAQAMRQFRDRAQGPMLVAASAYFSRMTAGRFTRLTSIEGKNENETVLVAQRANGQQVRVENMSEGTRDQLYLALRLAALALRRQAGADLPLVLDDVLMTSDDGRAALMLQALAEFSVGAQVILLTHHAHLLELARSQIEPSVLATVCL